MISHPLDRGLDASVGYCRRSWKSESARGGLRTRDLRMSQVEAGSLLTRGVPLVVLPYECGAMSN
jgi:hypothetical protein